MDNYKEVMDDWLGLCTKGMVRNHHHLLQEHGHYFGESSSLPSNYKLRKLRQCYYNSMMAALEDPDDKVYCEGYAVTSRLGLPMQHAWVYSMELGRVIDYTWRFKPGQAAGYFGIAFYTDVVRSYTNRTRRTGSILEEITRDLIEGGYSMPRDPTFLKDTIYEIPESRST